MTLRASPKPTMKVINGHLAKLLAYGVNSYQENVKVRGGFHQLFKRRRKRIVK